MRYVIFSDIHAYPKALKNVLEDIAGKRVDRTICLGDIVGLGPYPAGAVEMCRMLDVCVSGNNDEELVSLCGSGMVAADSANVVSREQILWLSQLPKIYAQDTFICTHKNLNREMGLWFRGSDICFVPKMPMNRLMRLLGITGLLSWDIPMNLVSGIVMRLLASDLYFPRPRALR